MHSSRSVIGLAALALAAVLAACGDDDEAGAPAPSSTSTSTSSSTTSSTTSTTTAPDGEQCSAAALPPEPSRQDLPEPVAEMRRSIVAAATACDFERLADLARPGSFTHSFGADGDPAGFWRRAEEDGEPAAALVHFLNQPVGTRPAGDVTQYLWPRAYAYESWAAVPAEARDELRPIYGTEDFKRFERFGSYNGYRVGITGGGDWVFFVGGD